MFTNAPCTRSTCSGFTRPSPPHSTSTEGIAGSFNGTRTDPGAFSAIHAGSASQIRSMPQATAMASTLEWNSAVLPLK